MNSIIQTPLSSSSNSLLFSTLFPPKRSITTHKYLSSNSSSISFPHKTSSIKSSVQTSYPETAAPTYKKFTKPASSLYEVLQVSRTATPAQIKSAYRALAKTYHPDASSNLQSSSSSSDGQDFIEINKAYLTLSDPASRALYDMKLGVFAGSFSKPAGGYYYSVRRWETDQCW